MKVDEIVDLMYNKLDDSELVNELSTKLYDYNNEIANQVDDIVYYLENLSIDSIHNIEYVFNTAKDIQKVLR